MDALRLYAKSCGMLMRSQWQYRYSFWLFTFTQLIMMGAELLAVLLLLDRFAAVGGWNAGEILFFFGLMTTSFYLVEAFGRGITAFSPFVQRGELDTVLVRPRGVLFQVLCSQADPRRFGAIAVGLAALILGAVRARVQWSALKALLLVWSIAGCGALVLALFMIEATLCFFSVKSVEMVNVLTYGGRSACQYPVDIYPRWLQLLFTVVAPFALTMHLPASLILDKPLWGAGAGWAFTSPLTGFLALAVMTGVFYRGLRHYRSTGS